QEQAFDEEGEGLELRCDVEFGRDRIHLADPLLGDGLGGTLLACRRGRSPSAFSCSLLRCFRLQYFRTLQQPNELPRPFLCLLLLPTLLVGNRLCECSADFR